MHASWNAMYVVKFERSSRTHVRTHVCDGASHMQYASASHVGCVENRRLHGRMQLRAAGWLGRFDVFRLFDHVQLPSPRHASEFVYCAQIGLHTGDVSHDCQLQREFSSQLVVVVLRAHDTSHLPVFQFQKHFGSASQDDTVVYACGHCSWHEFWYHSHAPTNAMHSALSVIVLHGAEHVFVVFDHMQSLSASHSGRVKYIELQRLMHFDALESHAQWSVPVHDACVVSALQLRVHSDTVLFHAQSLSALHALWFVHRYVQLTLQRWRGRKQKAYLQSASTLALHPVGTL